MMRLGPEVSRALGQPRRSLTLAEKVEALRRFAAARRLVARARYGRETS